MSGKERKHNSTNLTLLNPPAPTNRNRQPLRPTQPISTHHLSRPNPNTLPMTVHTTHTNLTIATSQLVALPKPPPSARTQSQPRSKKPHGPPSPPKRPPFSFRSQSFVVFRPQTHCHRHGQRATTTTTTPASKMSPSEGGGPPCHATSTANSAHPENYFRRSNLLRCPRRPSL